MELGQWISAEISQSEHQPFYPSPAPHHTTPHHKGFEERNTQCSNYTADST